MLLLSVVLLTSASSPVAVFALPLLLVESALTPLAVLALPVVLPLRASKTYRRVADRL